MEKLKKGYCFEGQDQNRLIILGEAVSHESGRTVYLCQELTGAYRLMVWTAQEILGQNTVCSTETAVREDREYVRLYDARDHFANSRSVQQDLEADNPEQLQQKMMLRFLEASSCSEKLEILDLMKGKLTDSMLESLAISMDYELGEGSVEEKYYALERFLKTKKRYEGSRLR
ncbi:MAG: hypothetical protein MR966_03840 [Lachnospiraceae bacterium]|nr:hypothetical protein [Lachnospiraceae bacterium]